MKIVLTLLLFTLTCKLSLSQANKDTLFLKMYNFLELKGEIRSKHEIKNYNEYFQIEELLTQDTMLKNDFGIYKFTTLLNEESGYNILIKIKDKYEFYDFYNFQYIVENLLQFNEDYPSYLCNELLIKYLNKLSRLYEENYGEILSNLIVKKQFGNYYFFISLDNYTP